MPLWNASLGPLPVLRIVAVKRRPATARAVSTIVTLRVLGVQMANTDKTATFC
jgi:hypothetical protein